MITVPGAALRPADLCRLAVDGLRTRTLRAALSALGIAIGVAAMVAVLGLSASSAAALNAEIAALGTNMLTVSDGQSPFGQSAELPVTAPAMLRRIDGVTRLASTGSVTASVYRNPLVPAGYTNALTVEAVSTNLLPVLRADVAAGQFLNPATATQPVAVLGSFAAQRLGIDQIGPGERVWLGGQWFYLAGILKPVALEPAINGSVLVGFGAAAGYLGFDGHPSTIYLRARTGQVDAVQSLLAATADPEAPEDAGVSQPSDALVAQADAAGAFSDLFLGLGAVALLVGGLGVANIMVIAVLERRGEIGLRRALGATRRHVRAQFLAEALLLSVLGGVAGVGLGAAGTAGYASVKGLAVVIPPQAWAGGLGAAIAIGAIAGLLPALRAARLSPTEALRSV
jgi:putative ABC transport system permease protein